MPDSAGEIACCILFVDLLSAKFKSLCKSDGGVTTMRRFDSCSRFYRDSSAVEHQAQDLEEEVRRFLKNGEKKKESCMLTGLLIIRNRKAIQYAPAGGLKNQEPASLNRSELFSIPKSAAVF